MKTCALWTTVLKYWKDSCKLGEYSLKYISYKELIYTKMKMMDPRSWKVRKLGRCWWNDTKYQSYSRNKVKDVYMTIANNNVFCHWKLVAVNLKCSHIRDDVYKLIYVNSIESFHSVYVYFKTSCCTG